MPDRAAVLIAVETFFEAAPSLPYASADAVELQRALPAVGYNPQKCLLLTGTRTTKAALESHLARLPKLVGKVETLIALVVSRAFSYKGHGYLTCADTLVADPAGTALSLADFMASLAKTKCPHIAVLLDLDPLTLPGELVPSGLNLAQLESLIETSDACVGLLATEPGERSYESGQLRHGVWRHHLLEALTGKVRGLANANGTLTAAALQAYLEEAVPRTLRRTHETGPAQAPRLLGRSRAEMVVADLSALHKPAEDVLDPARMRRVVFRAEAAGRVKELAGYRKSHALPDRANAWARKYVHRVAAADIKADLDAVYDRVRAQFEYKRKEVEVSTERDGAGFIRTPEFEYTVAVALNPDDPAQVSWQREVGRLTNTDFVRSAGFQYVFGALFDQLVFEFAEPVDVADFVDRLEEDPPEGVKVTVAGDAETAEIALEGFSGRITLAPDCAIIHGRPGHPASLLEQFLAFLRKFAELPR